MQLASSEIAQLDSQLQSYVPAHAAVDMLTRHDGQLEASIADLLVETYGAPTEFDQPSL